MKSSAHKALASLQQKYQALIRQHGKCKNEVRVNDSAIEYLQARIERLKMVEAAHVATIGTRNLTIERLESDIRVLQFRQQAQTGRTIYAEDYDKMERTLARTTGEARVLAGQVKEAQQSAWIYAILSAIAGAGAVYGLAVAHLI